MKICGVDGIGFVEFDKKDIVRHKLVQRIVEAYKRHDDMAEVEPDETKEQ